MGLKHATVMIAGIAPALRDVLMPSKNVMSTVTAVEDIMSAIKTVKCGILSILKNPTKL